MADSAVDNLQSEADQDHPGVVARLEPRLRLLDNQHDWKNQQTACSDLPVAASRGTTPMAQKRRP
jgi:hypothetical protein